MLREELTQHFPELVSAGALRFEVPLRDFCSFRIGGPAEAFGQPGTISQFQELLSFALDHNVPHYVLGRGSNLLISDQGLRGLVIQTSGLQRLSHDDDCVSAWCGVELRELCLYAQKLGLAGLEFASGIPGSVGGAVYMNAGAYGGEIKDVLYCSKYLALTAENPDQAGRVLHLKAGEHDFAYRSSVFQTQPYIHLSSVFRLHPDAPEAIAERMRQLERDRWQKQPMDLPSAGSVFKRPAGHFTGRLVDDCGLRGFRIGDAAVSDKHCGFIVNLGQATAAQVLAVIRHVQSTVFERFGVKLETELRFWGEE